MMAHPRLKAFNFAKWIEETNMAIAATPPRAVTSFDETFDVVVVGYGYAGAISALELERQDGGEDQAVTSHRGDSWQSRIVWVRDRRV